MHTRYDLVVASGFSHYVEKIVGETNRDTSTVDVESREIARGACILERVVPVRFWLKISRE